MCGHVQPRPPTKAELSSTLVLSLKLEEVSAKVRSGPAKDDAKDMDLPIWAGVLNMRSFVPQGGEADSQLKPDIATPAYVTDYKRPGQLQNGVH